MCDSNDTTSTPQPASQNPPQPPSQQQLRDSEGSLMRSVVEAYLASHPRGTQPSLTVIEQEIIADLLAAVLSRNSTAPKKDQWRSFTTLEAAAVAEVLAAYLDIIRIDFSDGEYEDEEDYPLYRYDEERGVYVFADDSWVLTVSTLLNYKATPGFAKAVRGHLCRLAPVKVRTRDANLDVVKNGIRNRATGELMPFSPEYVFTTKTCADWEDAPDEPEIVADDGYVFTPLTWLHELTGGREDLVQLIRALIHAVLRPNVQWEVAWWLVGQLGKNGKGTLCQLLRNLLGKGNYMSVPFAKFKGDNFRLARLPRVQAVICDENNVGSYIDDVEDYKASITGDPIEVNRKNKPHIPCRFYGSNVQCLNEVPRIRDRSGSFYRRPVIIPFDVSFIGRDRPEIKHDYLNRPEVLAWFQWWALSIDLDPVSIRELVPEDCKALLHGVKMMSNPVLDFFENVLWPRFDGTFVPSQCAYVLYVEWLKVTNPSAFPLGHLAFYDEIGPLFEEKGCKPMSQTKKKVPRKYMNGGELVASYNVAVWDKGRCPNSAELGKQCRDWDVPPLDERRIDDEEEDDDE